MSDSKFHVNGSFLTIKGLTVENLHKASHSDLVAILKKMVLSEEEYIVEQESCKSTWYKFHKRFTLRLVLEFARLKIIESAKDEKKDLIKEVINELNTKQ